MEPGQRVQASSVKANNHQVDYSFEAHSVWNLPPPFFPPLSTSQVNATSYTSSGSLTDLPVAMVQQVAAVQIVSFPQENNIDLKLPTAGAFCTDLELSLSSKLRKAIREGDEVVFLFTDFVGASKKVLFTDSVWEIVIEMFALIYEKGWRYESDEGENHHFFAFWVRIGIEQNRLGSIVEQFLFKDRTQGSAFTTSLAVRIEDFIAFLVYCQNKSILTDACWEQLSCSILSFYQSAYTVQVCHHAGAFCSLMGLTDALILFLSHFALLTELSYHVPHDSNYRIEDVLLHDFGALAVNVYDVPFLSKLAVILLLVHPSSKVKREALLTSLLCTSFSETIFIFAMTNGFNESNTFGYLNHRALAYTGIFSERIDNEVKLIGLKRLLKRIDGEMTVEWVQTLKRLFDQEISNNLIKDYIDKTREKLAEASWFKRFLDPDIALIEEEIGKLFPRDDLEVVIVDDFYSIV